MTEPDGIGGTDGVVADVAKTPSERYSNIRKALKGTTPMPAQTYLLAQIALILCDVQECLETQNAYLYELAVHK